MLLNIPKELHQVRQWTYSYDVKEKKRPLHSHYTTGGSLTLPTAKKKAGAFKYVGFYVTENDPYFLGDIDHVPNPEDPASCLRIEVADLLLNKGLYVERSPSGKGIRFIGKLPSIALKKQWEQNVFYTYPDPTLSHEEQKKQVRENQVNLGPPWMTLTGDKLPYSADSIPTLTIEDLEDVYNFKVIENKEKQAATVPAFKVNEKLPTFAEFKEALFSIPLDKNPRITRAAQKVFGVQKIDYEFWLNVLMGAHDYATKTNQKPEVLAQVCQWSMDDEKYTGEEDVVKKWYSFDNERHNTISYHTLFALAYHNKLNFPRKKPLTKQQINQGVTEGQPLNTEYVNFLALVNYYDIKLYRDTHHPAKLYITGDEDIILEYFSALQIKCYYGKYYGVFVEKTLTSAFHILCQDKGFLGIGHSYTIQHIRDWMYQVKREIDMVKYYFDMPFDKLPEEYQENKSFWDTSTPEHMFNCLDLDYLTADHAKERELYKRYYKKWLMGIARNLYFGDLPHMNNCVLLLTGKEQIRKTSHFKYMLPRFMREEQIAFTTHGFAGEQQVRDVTKIAASNIMVVWDEVERYLTAETESNFKMIIDNNPQKFIDKYEVTESVIKPVAIYGATSNKREFKLSDTGSRRLFIIPVKWVDTDTLDTICWHRVVNDLKYEIEAHKEGEPPWLLSAPDLQYQDFLHSKITAKTGYELLLEEIFQWGENYPFNEQTLSLPFNFNFVQGKHFLTTKDISQMLTLQTGGREKISRPALQRTLHRMCGRWTKTKNTTVMYSKPKVRVNNGLATYSSGAQKWIVPSVSKEYIGQI